MNKLKFIPIIILSLLVLFFFKSFILQGKLPIPADTIVGLYYPFRDIYSKTNPNGVPFKNFLITDPVRQQYPWRNLLIGMEKNGSLPLWNPYNFSGTPLLANFQSAAFYPFNFLLFLLPFSFSWSILILLQPLLAGVFLYLYLDNLKLKKTASLLGSITYSFCGFFVAWMEWGTIVSTALWLPLILLATDKIFNNFKINSIKNKTLFGWSFIFLLSLVSSFFAGHLQTFFYLFLFVLLYILSKFILSGVNLKKLGYFLGLLSIFLILTFIQWYPTIKFILLSAREIDLNWQAPGWFIPWQNLTQFVVPDFFGNPTTLNYWGIWNYGEFIGYVGIFPIIMSLFALFFRKDKKTLFFGMALFIALIFSLPTIFAKIPFEFKLPFVASSQPTRLLFVIDFSLSVLAAFGLDYFMKEKRGVKYIVFFVSSVFIFLWLYILLSLNPSSLQYKNLLVSRQNLIFPTLILILVVLCISFILLLPKKIKNYEKIIYVTILLLITISTVDLIRFGWKFEPFTNKEYLFPNTSVITFLQSQKDTFRIMSTDSRVFPPNFSIMYKLQTLDGYDPLYIQRYGELMAAIGRNSPNINPPFGFNRIITPQDPTSPMMDLLGVKYILSLNDLRNQKLKEVFTDGDTRIYENINSFQRAFFVKNTLVVNSKQEAINTLFNLSGFLDKEAIVEGLNKKTSNSWQVGKITFLKYKENQILIKTLNQGTGFLVLTDSFYPTWNAKIDGKKTKIYLTDFNFRGIIVPKGEHTIEFYDSLF
jgi:hypothetical protein